MRQRIRDFFRFINSQKFELAITILTFAYLYPVLDSGFICDDSFNSLIHGAAVNRGVSIWDMIANDEKYWFDIGRVFPPGPFILLLFDALAFAAKPRLYFKLYLVLMTLVNVWLCGMVVEKLTHSKRLKLFVMLIIPVFFQIALNTFNPLYAFHGLLQSVMLFGFLSILFTAYYLEKRKMRYMILSAVFMACAMLLYEVGFLFIFIIAAMVLINRNGSFFARVKTMIPQLIAFALILLINVYARLTAESISYWGVAVSLSDITTVAKTFIKQFSAAVPLTQAFFGGLNMKDALLSVNVRHMICLFFAVLLYFIIFRIKRDDDQESAKPNMLVIVTGLILIVVPCALISVSARYQNIDVYLGVGHLPVYAEWLGMAFVATGLFSLIGKKIRSNILMYVLCAVVALPILVININTMDAYFIYMKPHSAVSRDVYTNAVRNGFYDEIDENNLLVYDNSPQLYALVNGDFFATYADRKMAALDINTYMQGLQVESKMPNKLEDGEPKARFTKEIYYDAVGGIVLKGDLDGIRINDAESSKSIIYLSDVRLYVDMPSGTRTMTLHFTDWNDDERYSEKTVELDLRDAASGGHIVDIESSGWIDANSVRIE